MRSRSARLLFAFVLITKNSISWQYPTAQTQRRPSRDVIFPQDHRSIRTRVAGGNNSGDPSVAAIIGGTGGTAGIHSLPPPSIIIPDGVNSRPSKEEIIWRILWRIKKQNPPSIGQGGGSFVVNNRDLERVFQYCGHFLERCQVPNTPTNTGSHIHLHNRPVRNGGFHHGQVHSPFSRPSLPGNIPVWP